MMTDSQRQNLMLRFEALMDKLEFDGMTAYKKGLSATLEKVIASFIDSESLTDFQRRKELTRIITDELSPIYSKLNDDILDQMSEMATYTSLFVSGLYLETPIQKIMKFNGNTLIHGYELKDLIKSNKDHHLKAFKVYVANGITQGQTPSKVLREMKKQNALKSRHIETTTVQSVMSVARAEAKADVYSELERDGAVSGYEFIATLDSHTSLGCSERDGKRYKNYKTIPAGDITPRHFRCRSQIIPIGTNKYPRAGKDYNQSSSGIGAQYRSDMKYKEWFGIQPKSVQYHILQRQGLTISKIQELMKL